MRAITERGAGRKARDAHHSEVACVARTKAIGDERTPAPPTLAFTTSTRARRLRVALDHAHDGVAFAELLLPSPRVAHGSLGEPFEIVPRRYRHRVRAEGLAFGRASAL